VREEMRENRVVVDVRWREVLGGAPEIRGDSRGESKGETKGENRRDSRE
jgi:hypothetical protein